jgi:hypothetical protein
VELLSPWSESVETSDTIVGAVRAPKNFQEEISKKISIEDVWKRFRKRPWLW